MRRLLKVLVSLVLLGLTWAFAVLHLGVFPPPIVPSATAQIAETKGSKWIERTRDGVHHLVLVGSPYERGLFAGEKTVELLRLQERTLTDQLDLLIPSRWLQRIGIVALIRWFWGIEPFFEPWMVEEMYGVSKSAPPEFNFFADPLTRQIAYHGIHEVGQMAVDQGSDDMGCTVITLPSQGGWVIGRNFDFESGRVFDTEKIVKWVFPENGNALVSVIWAGMVGAVTGVNEKGVYISINAAGSTDFRRHGVPSTLVILKALQEADTAEQAIEVIRASTMFITDIFVIADRRGRVYRVEKSPHAMEVLPIERATAVVNHLIADRWKEDRVNRYRREELTTLARGDRGQALLDALSGKDHATPRAAEAAVLKILRDKGVSEGEPLHLGNRAAIDALIATHAVIFNTPENILYVSRGPGVSGSFAGYDLTASFARREPVLVRELAKDPLVTEEAFHAIRLSAQEVSRAQKLIRKGRCAEAKVTLDSARGHFDGSYGFQMALGDYADQCLRQPDAARAHWVAAKALHPAYPRELRALEERLAR